MSVGLMRHFSGCGEERPCWQLQTDHRNLRGGRVRAQAPLPKRCVESRLERGLGGSPEASVCGCRLGPGALLQSDLSEVGFSFHKKPTGVSLE